MDEILRPAAVSKKNSPFVADYHADRFTVAKKNSTSAETYGEPQTPVNRFAVALSSELPEFSTAVLAAKRVIRLPMVRKGRSTHGPARAQLFRIPHGDCTP